MNFRNNQSKKTLFSTFLAKSNNWPLQRGKSRIRSISRSHIGNIMKFSDSETEKTYFDTSFNFLVKSNWSVGGGEGEESILGLKSPLNKIGYGTPYSKSAIQKNPVSIRRSIFQIQCIFPNLNFWPQIGTEPKIVCNIWNARTKKKIQKNFGTLFNNFSYYIPNFVACSPLSPFLRERKISHVKRN